MCINMFRKIAKNIIDGWIQLESVFVARARPVQHGSNNSRKRVLIFRKDTLGDYLLFYPTLKAYRQKYIDADITLVVTSLFSSLSPLLSDFEEIIWFDAKKFSKGFLYRRNFLLVLKRKGFDIAIYTSSSREPMGNFMMQMTGAPEKICMDGDLAVITEKGRERSKKLYTTVIDVPENIVSEIDRNIYMVEQITNKKIDVHFPTLNLDQFGDAKNAAEKILSENNLFSRRFVVFFPGSGTTFKIWPTEKFAVIADYFISKDIVPVFCGSKGEKPLIADIIKNMKSASVGNSVPDNQYGFVDISGQTDVPTMGYILKHSLFYFGSDNGIAHLSTGLGTPVICLLGGGFGFRFFPYGDLTKNKAIIQIDTPCWNDSWACAKNLPNGVSAPCVQGIPVESVIQEIDILLSTPLEPR